eukprot:12496970-Heterocapsa_arctica.AAC.1
MMLEVIVNVMIEKCNLGLHEVMSTVPDSMDLSREDIKVYAEEVATAKKNECQQWLDLHAAKLVPSIEAAHSKGQTL